MYKSSHPEIFFKEKVILENLQNSKEKTCVGVPF